MVRSKVSKECTLNDTMTNSWKFTTYWSSKFSRVMSRVCHGHKKDRHGGPGCHKRTIGLKNLLHNTKCMSKIGAAFRSNSSFTSWRIVLLYFDSKYLLAISYIRWCLIAKHSSITLNWRLHCLCCRCYYHWKRHCDT